MDEFRKQRALRHYESLKMQLGLSKAEELLTVKSKPSDRFNDLGARTDVKLADLSPAVVLYYARYIVCQHKARLGYDPA